MSTKDETRRLHRARQMFRLCCGVERALRKIGFRATVRDALAECGMSRRSFYEFFISLDDVYERMQRAVPELVKLYQQRRPDPEDTGPCDEHEAYRCVLADFPHAELLLALMGNAATEERYGQHGYRLTDAADTAKHTTFFDSSCARPVDGLPAEFLLAFYTAMNGKKFATENAVRPA